MKKTFFSTLLTIAVIAFNAAPVTASAAEPKAEKTADRLDAAKAYYIDNMVNGVNIGRKIAGGEPLSPEQTEAVREASGKWMNTELIPFLEKNGLLEEWVTMQFDKDIRELNRKTAQAQSMDDIVSSARGGMELTKLRYPKSFAMYTTPECNQVMQKLQLFIMQALVK